MDFVFTSKEGPKDCLGTKLETLSCPGWGMPAAACFDLLTCLVLNIAIASTLFLAMSL